MPNSHSHPEQEERFTVRDGMLRFRIGWRRSFTQVPETPERFYTGIQVTPEGVATGGIEALGLTVTITPAEDTAPAA